MNTELIIDNWRLDPSPVAQRDAAMRALEAGDIFNFFNIVEDLCQLLTRGGRHG